MAVLHGASPFPDVQSHRQGEDFEAELRAHALKY